jgi:long-chain acyl-CoA synthetase
MYGQTEATSRISYVPPQMLHQKLGSVGIPIQGVSIEIRDDLGKPLPGDGIGHIWVRGPNTMLGYWNNPSLTAKVLIDGWLDTGDMGWLDEDGYLFIVGRRSDIIKTGAHRVHPQDIEAAISQLNAVAEVAVVGVDDPILGEVVKAYIVPKGDHAVTDMDVRRHCLQCLAQYKVPKIVQIVSSLPRTASGKVLRQELKTWSESENV